MDDSAHRKPSSLGREPLARRQSWCCSFAIPSSSPDDFSVSSRNHHHHHKTNQHRAKANPPSKPGFSSIPSSPQSSKPALNIVGRMDPRRILSPGRVSPIDSDPAVDSIQDTVHDASPVVDSAPKSRSESFRAPKIEVSVPDQGSGSGLGQDGGIGYGARLNLKGRNGGVLVLELSSVVLAANSEVFAELIAENKKGSSSPSSSPSSSVKRGCRIEVPDVENLGVFRETIELMFDDGDNITRRLMKIGVCRAIGVLEVAAGIKFTRAVLSCLKYLEAVPWTEEEEEKLRRVLTMFEIDDATTRDIFARLCSSETSNSQQSLSGQLVWSITSCTNANARNDLKSLVKGLFCKSSVYEKGQLDLNKEDIYAVCQSCLDSLLNLINESSNNSKFPLANVAKKEKDTEKPLIERVSRQVENINWLLEIMLDWDIAEDFVDLWAKQKELVKLHENASPMVRYELSRVSAILFTAMGTGKVQCRSESRSGLLEAWFGPMLVDFGWLQRCKKGLDVRQLEEGLGQTLLTLPLKQQYMLFMEWFRWFSTHGTECPNLSKAFQIWWRRSFLRG